MNNIKKFCFFGLVVGSLLCIGVQTSYAGAFIRLPKDGWLRINYEMQLYGQWRDTGSGPDKTSDTTDVYFRRNRLSFRGQATKTYGFYLAMEHEGARKIGEIEILEPRRNEFFVLDAFFMAKFTDELNLRAGLFKDPLVRDHNVGCFFNLGMDRSLFVYTSIPRRSRDYGVLLWGNLMDKKVQYKLSVMEGIDNKNTPKSTFRYTGRVHLTLLDPESIPLYFGTYLGKKKVLTFGAGYQIEPDAVYGNVAAKTLQNDYQAWTYDVFFEYPTPSGTFTATAAYLESDFDETYKGGDPDPVSMNLDGEKNGWYVNAGYLLPDKIGPGNVQFYGRYEKWNFAKLGGIFGQEIKWTSVGVNYLLNGHKLRVTLEYSKNDFDKEDASTVDFSTVTTMLQFLF